MGSRSSAHSPTSGSKPHTEHRTRAAVPLVLGEHVAGRSLTTPRLGAAGGVGLPPAGAARPLQLTRVSVADCIPAQGQ